MEQDLSGLIADMDKINMAVMVNLSGGSGERLSAALENVNKNYPNRFVVFANVDFDGVGNPGWAENAVAQLENDDLKMVQKALRYIKAWGSGTKMWTVTGWLLMIRDWILFGTNVVSWEYRYSYMPQILNRFWDPMDSDNERWLEL